MCFLRIFGYRFYIRPELWPEVFLKKFGDAANPLVYFNIIAWLACFPYFGFCAILARDYGALSESHQSGFDHSAFSCFCLIVFGMMSVRCLTFQYPSDHVIGITLGGLIVGFITSISAAVYLHTVPTVKEMSEYVGGFYLVWNHTPYVMEAIQYEKNCCGIISLYDYIDLHMYDINPGVEFDMPDSCCKEHSEGCGSNSTYLDITPEGRYHQNSCGLEGYMELHTSVPHSMWVMVAMVKLSRIHILFSSVCIVVLSYYLCWKWPRRLTYKLFVANRHDRESWKRYYVYRDCEEELLEFEDEIEEILWNRKDHPRFKKGVLTFHAPPPDPTALTKFQKDLLFPESLSVAEMDLRHAASEALILSGYYVPDLQFTREPKRLIPSTSTESLSGYRLENSSSVIW